jgi:hypothetical protein
MFVVGSTASVEEPKEAPTEAREKSVVDKAAEIVAEWWADSYFKRISAKIEHKPVKVERGPGADYDPSLEVMRELTRAILGLRHLKPPKINGDEGDRGIKLGQLVISVVALLITVIGAAWGLSEQMSNQFGEVRTRQAAQSTAIENVREHQREQDDRSTRIEEQLRELANRSHGPGS